MVLLDEHDAGQAARETRRLLQAWSDRRDPDARSRLIELYLPLVRALARGFARRGEQLDDLTQIGAVGLIKAVDRYDPCRGTSLGAYAAPTIVGEIRRHLRDSALPVRLPRAGREAGLTIQTVPLAAAGEAPPDASAEQSFERGEERVLIEAGLRALPKRQRRIVQLRYFGDLSQRGIANELGVSQVHVSRQLRESLGTLRREIGGT